MILLTPGPCMTSESVRAAAAMPDRNHRDPLFLETLADIRQQLVNVYPCSHSVFLLGGSGTAAVEAMITSCVDVGPVLILENGYYSERLRAICEIHAIPYEILNFGWGGTYDLDQIERVLSGSTFEAVLALHNETTVGRLNPVNAIAKICKRTGTRLLVDAMSSFGADDLDVADIDAVCASANKCLHGIPGVGFVLVQPLLAVKLQTFRRRTFYLWLPMYAGDAPPLTAPVANLEAFRVALQEFPGQAARKADYLRKATSIRNAARLAGLHLALPEEESSCSLSTIAVPPGFTGDTWLDVNRKSGYLVYGCKGDLKDAYFQAANMGDLTIDQVQGWCELLPELITGS